MTTAILLCRDGLDETLAEPCETIIIDHLCRHPDRIGSAIAGGDRLVLGLCEGEYSLGAVQAEVRRAGVDPLGVELIHLTTIGQSAAPLDVVLNARIARAEAFAGSSPVNAKISFPRKVSRRELFSGPDHEYRAAPSIDVALCAADSGCRACVDVCPQEALTVQDRQVSFDRSVCEPCGLCVTTCPTGATVDPATTTSQLEAEIAGLLDPSVGRAETRSIVFTCARGNAPEAIPGWYAVTVPCSGMVRPGWILAPLLMGAGAVAVLPCSESGCELGHDARVDDAVEFCRLLLSSFDESSERVMTTRTSVVPKPLPRVALTDPFGPIGAVGVMQALAARHEEARNLLIDHQGAPTGIVQLNPVTCTACTRCVQTCPTGALGSANAAEHVTITFDANLCTACEQCTQACPELSRRAISLRSTTDMGALLNGRIALLESDTILCDSCGKPIAPAPLMERITKMLGPGQDAVRAMITSRCVSCRSG